MNPKLDTPTLFDSRNQYLQQYHSRMRGYRPDMQALLSQGQELYPMRPAIHALIATLYQDMLDKVQVNEEARSAAENLYTSAKTKVISYVQLKMDNTGSSEKVRGWDAWAKEAGVTRDRTTAEALMKASDHIEDTLFLADLSGMLQLPSSRTHAHEEIVTLLEKLNEYLALLPLETAQKLRDSLLPAIKEADTFYTQSNYPQEHAKLEAAFKALRGSFS